MWAIVLMNERVTREERLQSPGEEIANSVSAGAGLIARTLSGRVTAIARRDPPTPPDVPFSASGG